MASQRPSSPKSKDALDQIDSTGSRVEDVSKESDRKETVDDKNSADQNNNKTGFESFDTKISLLDANSDAKDESEEPENDLDFSPTDSEKPSSKKQDVEESTKSLNPHADLKEMNFLLLQKNNEQKPERSPNIEIVEGSQLQIRGDKGTVISDISDPILTATIKRNQLSGDIDTIRYPCGKQRNFSYENNQLSGIETLETTKNRTFSKSDLVKEDGIWFAELNGIKAVLPGDIQFNKSGTLSFELNDNGKWRCERPDGVILLENSVTTGARIAYLQDNSIQQLTRADGTCLDCKYKNGRLTEVTEYDKDGNKTTWTKSGRKWISDSVPPQKRYNFKVYPNGNVRYSEEDGTEKIVTTRGMEFTNDKNSNNFQLDKTGRFTSINHPQGLKVEGVKYNEENKLAYARINDDSGNVVHYARQENSNSWMLTVTDQSGLVIELKNWQGDIKVSDDGTVFLKDESLGETAKQGQWKVYNPDGTEEFVDSSKLTFDESPTQKIPATNNQDQDDLSAAASQSDLGELDNQANLTNQVDFSSTVTKSVQANLTNQANQQAVTNQPTQPVHARQENTGTSENLENMVCSDSGSSINANYHMLSGKVESKSDLEIEDKIKRKDLEEEELDLEEIENIDDARPEGAFSDSVIVARDNLTELMETHLDEPQRKRFQIILDRYEKRGKNRIEAQVAAGQDPEKCRIEWDEKIAKSYDSLASMLDPNLPNATYDLRVRAKLVESMAFALACPVKANDQGNWGCCWMISGVFAGIIQYPEKMTDMLAQLSNTGQFTDLEGKTWTPPKGLLSITNQGGGWTIENCGGGHRSPTSEILTSVAAYLSADGRRTDRGSSGGTGQACNHAMKKITGDTWTVTSEQNMVKPQMRQELLEKGAYICIYPGHMYLAALEKHGEDWLVCASLQHGDGGRRINGTVSDLQSWTITGGRRRYNPDIDLPECQDSPTGAIGNDWPGGSTFRDGYFPNIFAPDQWPLSISFALRMLDEADRVREKEREEDEEERIKKLETERLKEERELAEIEDAKRRDRKAKEIAERREEEELRIKKIEEERTKKRREQLIKKKHQLDLQNEEKYRKLKTLERAQAMESSDTHQRRSNQPNNGRTTSRRLSEQILDLKSTRVDSDNTTPSWSSTKSTQSLSQLDGLGLNYKPMSSNLSSQVELASPISEVSPELKVSQENQSSSPKSGE